MKDPDEKEIEIIQGYVYSYEPEFILYSESESQMRFLNKSSGIFKTIKILGASSVGVD